MATTRKNRNKKCDFQIIKEGKKTDNNKTRKNHDLGWVGTGWHGRQEGEIFLGFCLVPRLSINICWMNEWTYILRSLFKNSVENLELNQTICTHHTTFTRTEIKGWENISLGKTDTKRASMVILVSDKKFKAKWVKVNQKQYFTWPFSWEAQANQLNRWGQSVRGQDTN